MSQSYGRVINLKGNRGQLDGATYVGRSMSMGGAPIEGSKYANRAVVGAPGKRVRKGCVLVGNNLEACQWYAEWIAKRPDLIESARAELRGKTLACWCAPHPCHANVLLMIANNGQPPPRGRVRMDSFRMRQPKKFLPNYHTLVVKARVKRWAALSPMKLVPQPFYEIRNGVRCLVEPTCLENMWQASKVEAKYFDPDDPMGAPPVAEWWARRDRIFADPKAHRHVVAKADRCEPKDARVYWKGEYLSYEVARRVVYLQQYATLAIGTKEFKEMVRMMESGYNLLIVGPDGRDIKLSTEAEEKGADSGGDDGTPPGLEREDFVAALKDISKPAGHEFALAAMLAGYVPHLL